MRNRHYVKRLHWRSTAVFEYVRASRGGDLETWLHVAAALGFLLFLVLAVLVAGGSFDF